MESLLRGNSKLTFHIFSYLFLQYNFMNFITLVLQDRKQSMVRASQLAKVTPNRQQEQIQIQEIQ